MLCTGSLAVEILIAAQADCGEIQVIYLGRRVKALMPAVFVTMAESDDVGERVVIVDYEGEIAHRFIAVVCGYKEGTIWFGVFSDDVGVFDPVRWDVLHPLNGIV